MQGLDPETSGVVRTKLIELERCRAHRGGRDGEAVRREERVRALERSDEELLASYAELVPGDKRHRYQLLRIEVSVPREGEIEFKLPFVTDDAEFRLQETAS